MIARILAATACVVCFVRATPADACTSEPQSGLAALGAAQPATGATAPPNTKIWVPAGDGSTSVQADDVVIAAGDAVIATTPTAVVIDGEVKRTVWMFTPEARLAGGATITVTVQGQVASQFMVAGGDDVTAPATPAPTRVDVEGAYFGGFTCPEPSRVAVTVAGNDELLLITQTPATGMPTSALAMAIGTHATAVDLAEGAHALHLLAVDFAGNASASAAMPELTVPTEQSGCSAGSQQSGWLIVGLVVLGIRRKRKSPCVGPAR